MNVRGLVPPKTTMLPRTLRRAALAAAALLAAAPQPAAADPLACQPNALQPMVPIFHIIGNVTLAGGGISLEPINDASGITYSDGIYHVWHQCCQNHWDHVISKDLVHWQRLPPPIQPVTLKTWDGSISMTAAADGGPLILYDAQDGKLGSHGQDPRTPADSPILGVARLVDPANDRYLQHWVRADNNPCEQVGDPIAFPGPVWKSGDHWNFIGQGNRFESTDSSFVSAVRGASLRPTPLATRNARNTNPTTRFDNTQHTWTNKGTFVGMGEHSGQWTFPTPNAVDGSPPPANAPNLCVNVNGGADYLLGTYTAANESFASSGTIAHLEGGGADWWGASGGADNNGRAMMVGWAMPDYNGPAGPGITFLTRLTLVREINYDAASGGLVSNPLPELVGLRSGSLASERGVALALAPHVVAGTGAGAAASADVNVTFRLQAGGPLPSGAVFGACVLANGALEGLGVRITMPGGASDYYMPGVDLPGGDYNVTDVQYSDPHICQAACTADGPKCQAFTYVTRPPLVGSCCLKGIVPNASPNPSCTSGVKAPASGITVQVGACSAMMGRELPAADAPQASSFELSGGSLPDTISLRLLPDRSVADVFVQGGRWAGTVAWLGKDPRAPGDSTVALWANATATVVADVDVWAMGCGWADPSYTENPTM